MAMRPSKVVSECGEVAGSGSSMLSRISSVSGFTATSCELGCFMPSAAHLMIATVPCSVQPVGRVWSFRISVPSGAIVRCL